MTDIAAPVPAQPFSRPAQADGIAPLATQGETRCPPVRGSLLRRLAAALADTHQAAVPF